MAYKLEPYEGWEDDLALLVRDVEFETSGTGPSRRLAHALVPTHDHDWRIDPHQSFGNVWGAAPGRMMVRCSFTDCGESREVPRLDSSPKTDWPKYTGPVLPKGANA